MKDSREATVKSVKTAAVVGSAEPEKVAELKRAAVPGSSAAVWLAVPVAAAAG